MPPVAVTPAAQQAARLSVDIAAADVAASASASGARSDFRRSPLGRTVVTALEARLDRVCRLLIWFQDYKLVFCILPYVPTQAKLPEICHVVLFRWPSRGAPMRS